MAKSLSESLMKRRFDKYKWCTGATTCFGAVSLVIEAPSLANGTNLTDSPYVAKLASAKTKGKSPRARVEVESFQCRLSLGSLTYSIIGRTPSVTLVDDRQRPFPSSSSSALPWIFFNDFTRWRDVLINSPAKCVNQCPVASWKLLQKFLFFFIFPPENEFLPSRDKRWERTVANLFKKHQDKI